MADFLKYDKCFSAIPEQDLPPDGHIIITRYRGSGPWVVGRVVRNGAGTYIDELGKITRLADAEKFAGMLEE